jgi:transcriptional regulator with XRE-family HTH domain
MTPFGERLREHRSRKGVTLKVLAQELGVTAAYLSALETGRRGLPAPGMVMQICGALGLIWDEAEELKRLAAISQPKVTLDASGLSPKAVELANRLKKTLRDLPEETIDALLATLDSAGK